ncbi:hypothetical protein HGM15179_018157 [Zosterops borbonicus]|uniref:Uncharacterized protein n=1 Tax=Zosterops borbonicus TaxID=364589 RepID=A0A8K1FZK6_9PASS|nr:hypothetical protein HGM15179_018157 [Zosterops borbonicus]
MEESGTQNVIDRWRQETPKCRDTRSYPGKFHGIPQFPVPGAAPGWEPKMSSTDGGRRLQSAETREVTQENFMEFHNSQCQGLLLGQDNPNQEQELGGEFTGSSPEEKDLGMSWMKNWTGATSECWEP